MFHSDNRHVCDVIKSKTTVPQATPILGASTVSSGDAGGGAAAGRSNISQMAVEVAATASTATPTVATAPSQSAEPEAEAAQPALPKPASAVAETTPPQTIPAHVPTMEEPATDHLDQGSAPTPLPECDTDGSGSNAALTTALGAASMYFDAEVREDTSVFILVENRLLLL